MPFWFATVKNEEILHLIEEAVPVNTKRATKFGLEVSTGKECQKSKVKKNHKFLLVCSARFENWPVAIVFFLCVTLAHANSCTHILVSLD